MRNEPLRQRYRRFWGSDPRKDFDDEIAFHLAMREEELVHAGLTPQEAREQTMKRFGDVEGIRGECHEMGSRRASRRQRASRWDGFRQDLRYALRTLRTHRAFSLAVIVTMALGIGATSAVFSVAYGVLLRPLPYTEADALVRLWSKNEQRGLEFFSVSPAEYADWKAQQRSFSAMGAFERQREAVLSRNGDPSTILTAAVTPDIFSLLGTTPQLGRNIVAADGGPGASPVVLLSHDAWVQRFGSDPSVIGGDLLIDGHAYRVIGVMPPRFIVPGTPAEIWTPLSLAGASDDHGNRYLRVLARLAPGMDVDRARTELDVIAGRLAVQHPGTNTGWTVNMMPVTEMIIGTDFRRAVLVLLGVVGFVLFIACANAANLQLARAASRRREIAMRSTLGASRGRIIAQLLSESAVLAAIAGVAGLAIAYGAIHLLRIWGTQTVPRLEDVRLDAPVLAFTLVIALASGILFGLVPAIRASRTDLAETLKEGVRGIGAGTVGEGVRSLLVVSEIMLSLILLIGAGLLMQSFVRLQSVEVGFDPRGVHVVPFRLPETSYPEAVQTSAFYWSVLEQVKAIPGVTAAAAVSNAPFAGPNSGLVFMRVDRPIEGREQAPDADYRVITPEYLSTIGIPIVRGRNFTATDRASDFTVAVISETMARDYWRDADPIGSRIRLGDVNDGPVVTIIGVAGDARYQTLETPEVRPMMYFSLAERPQRAMTLVLRTSDPTSAAAGIRRVLASVDTKLAPPPVTSLDSLIRDAFATRRFALMLFGIFAGVATVLAGVGIYGVMSFLVKQRTHELGIRVALGASQGRLMTSVLARALRLTVAGVALGLIGAWLLRQSMGSLLFEVSPTDRATFAAVAFVVVAIGLLASFVPARRAMRADPMEALRGEV
jgi:predicted permease